MTRVTALLGTAALMLASPALGQRADTISRNDSAAHAGAHAPTAPLALTIGAIADLLIDASPDGTTLESERRFELREIQLALGAGIDRYARGDIVLSLDDAQQLSVMEASLTSVGLPRRLQLKAGRFHLPFGKQNAIHRAHLPTIDYPLVIRRFLGTQGGMGTGLGLNKIFGLLGFTQELQLTAIEQFPDDHGHEADTGHHAGIEGRPASPANKTLEGLGYTARLRSSWTVSEAGQVELAVSAGTGKRAHPFGCGVDTGHPTPCPAARGETGVNARRSLVGGDLTIRLRSAGAPHEWLLVQSEVMRLHNENPALPRGAPDSASYLGPTAEETGAYVLARWRAAPRLFVGGRFDWLELGNPAARDLGGLSAYLQFALSEVAKVTAAYERVRPEIGKDVNRVLIQAVIGIGTHPPHTF